MFDDRNIRISREKFDNPKQLLTRATIKASLLSEMKFGLVRRLVPTAVILPLFALLLAIVPKESEVGV